uniref:Uncharacterized protein n=1 Tax=Emiliania huxleyi (strain CCMP1516) TaxID=280463 RepID=A0A0D3J469_EMIH1
MRLADLLCGAAPAPRVGLRREGVRRARREEALHPRDGEPGGAHPRPKGGGPPQPAARLGGLPQGPRGGASLAAKGVGPAALAQGAVGRRPQARQGVQEGRRLCSHVSSQTSWGVGRAGCPSRA